MMHRVPASEPFVSDRWWYKDATIYELHVRAFHDSDADGVGDFRGLTRKLDYLQELGVTAVWLLPFYPSPLRDDGYDIADYTNIHPLYGTLKDFDAFLDEAHRLGIRVITELVLNHTSDQHPWFQRARRAKPGSVEREFYMWSDAPDKFSDARIIFKDFETSNWAYDASAAAYYWHRFYSHQPDLNFDSPAVQKAMLKVLDFWLGRGVDGLRLDAVPYLYAREGTNCENLPETHAFLKRLRHHVDSRHASKLLLAEANQWPEDAAAYFGDGDECHMNFHFPLMPRLFMAVTLEDRYPIIDILEQTPTISETAQWAIFLRNHDELTLEMVTDEERDYMYRTYARDRRARVNLGIRRRLAPLLGNNRRRIELMNALLFSLPGTPVVYYGDEIGMGDNVYLGDRNGVRTPMQWSADRNAGFSRANPQSLYLPVIIDPEYHYETVNVEAQMNNPSSLFWWMKRLIGLRKHFDAFGRGTMELLFPDNRKVFAFLRRHGEQVVLVVANLSRFVQCTHLDLRAFTGRRPVELFGRVEFPVIGAEPYFLSLGPHSFYWFALPEPKPGRVRLDVEPATLSVTGEWTALLEGRALTQLEATLVAYLPPRRWFRSKARTVDHVDISDAINVTVKGELLGIMMLVHVAYTEGEPETYLLPLSFVQGQIAREIYERWPHAVIAQVFAKKSGGGERGLLVDGAYDANFARGLLEVIDRRRELKTTMPEDAGKLVGWKTPQLRDLREGAPEPLPALVGQVEQSNTSVIFHDRLILKLYRLIEEGMNPEVEMGRFLTEEVRFAHTPPVAGAIEYQRGKGVAMTLALLQGFVHNQGDAWQFTLDELQRYFERAASMRALGRKPPLISRGVIERSAAELPDIAYEAAGPYFESARVLGERLAALHSAVARNTENPDFKPEPFTPFYRRSFYQSLRNLTHQALSTLDKRRSSLSDEERDMADYTLGRREQILAVFQVILDRKITALRVRTHGDLHLGQVLYTGRDFVIIDFEGEPARSLADRRIPRCPLRDVAGMLRSFHYAAEAALHTRVAPTLPTVDEVNDLDGWATAWRDWVGSVFVRSYLRNCEGEAFLGANDEEELERLFDVYLLEKALYELNYELNNRPEWVFIPLEGIVGLLGKAGE